MAAPVLSDYEYQYKDSGLLLNGPEVLPFWDVLSVQGLDTPEVEPKIDDIDFQHGSAMYAKYTKGRLIVLEGFLYANPSTIETTVDDAIANFLPDDINAPFYFKQAGISQRYINAKSFGIKIDTSTLRRIGSAAFQIQLGAERPEKRVDNADTTLAVANTDYNVTNSGKIPTWPIFTVTGAYTSITLRNNSTAEQLVVTHNAIAGDVTVVDMHNRSVTINGVQNSSKASGTWWDINASSTVALRYSVTGGPPTSVVAKTYSGWM